jgi:Cytochrome P460
MLLNKLLKTGERPRPPTLSYWKHSGLLSIALFLGSTVYAQSDLGIAQYNSSNELLYPANLDEWIQTGASLGGEYSDNAFDPQSPGNIGIVQMEPTAYRYFMQHHSYADGTMFLLSFYKGEGKSEPQLPGFVQGDLLAQEIHVIDKARFTEGRGFFLFRTPAPTSSVKVADGSECVACHNEHADFDGTFSQFYPTIRAHLQD